MNLILTSEVNTTKKRSNASNKSKQKLSVDCASMKGSP